MFSEHKLQIAFRTQQFRVDTENNFAFTETLRLELHSLTHSK